jgi:TatD DNase family protein
MRSEIEVFQRQLEAARAVSKPVAVHCRDAQEAMLPLIEAWSRGMRGLLPDGRPLGVMHYFAGDIELGKRYASMGFMISIHTSITYPKSDQMRDVARTLPLETLVVETDSPYGAPQSMRGK